MDRTEIDQLWTLPLEDFTRARDDLAKRAKDEGDGDAAKEIKALRKPSVGAWAVNQLARRRPEDIRRLLGLGDVMRKAQQEALEGGGREALRTATAERRRLVDQLTEDAGALLAKAGHGSSRTVLDKVSDTLTATATDEETAELVAGGTLQRDATPQSGLEQLAGLMPAKPRGRDKSRPVSKPSADTRQRFKRASELARRLEEEASAIEEKASQLRSEADRLSREAEKAARAAEREERRAAEARERADGARADAAETEGRDDES